MIKIDVIVKDKTWLKFIKNPESYLKRKIKIIQRDKFFKKKKYQFRVLLSVTKEIKQQIFYPFQVLTKKILKYSLN